MAGPCAHDAGNRSTPASTTDARRWTLISTDTSTHGEIVEIVGVLTNASNGTLLARDDNGKLVVYKPSFGAQPLHDFDHQTLAAREILTFEVSQAMGTEIIPPTRFVEGPYGIGSAQVFIDEDRTTDQRTLLEGPDARLWPFAMLDVVTNNADRKLGHLLLEVDSDRVWGIDNGLTFHHLPKLRTVLWGFADRELPDHMVDCLERLEVAMRGGLQNRIVELLSETEATATVARLASLLTFRVHPPPPVDRQPLPWPWW